MKNVNLDAEGRPHWTLKTLLIGKPWSVIGSIVFYNCFIHIPLYIIGEFLPVPMSLQIFIDRYSIPISLLIATPIGIHMQVKRANLSLDEMTPEEAVHTYEMESRFKWSPIYGYLIAGALWYVSVMVCAIVTLYVIGIPVEEVNISTPVALGTIVAAVAFALWLNRFMLRKTQTNHQLLDELRQGLHWDEIPEELLTDENKRKVMKRLRKGKIFSMEEAVVSLKSDEASKKAVKVGGIIGIVIAFLGLTLMSSVSSEVDNCTREISEEITGSSDEAKRRKQKEEEDLRLWKRGRAERMFYMERDRAKTSAAYNDAGKAQEHLNKMKFWRNQYDENNQ